MNDDYERILQNLQLRYQKRKDCLSYQGAPERGGHHIFFACKDDWLIPISIADNPYVFDIGEEYGDFADAIEWAKKNSKILIKHWGGTQMSLSLFMQ